MKKVLKILILFVFVLMLTACAKTKDNGQDKKSHEELIEIEGPVEPILLNYNTIISKYDITGDGIKDDIYITCNDVLEEDGMIGNGWEIKINDQKAHDFEWEDGIRLTVELYQISNKRQYLTIMESYEANDDRAGFALYQVIDGKLEQVCDFHKSITESINEFHYGSEIIYMTKDEMLVRARNQFNATANLEFNIKYYYRNDIWEKDTNEYDIHFSEDYTDKANGMTANQPFVVYTKKDSETVAYNVEKGDILKFHSVYIEDGETYFKVTNEDGVVGWLPDADEPYTEINGQYLEGLFEEAMFAG